MIPVVTIAHPGDDLAVRVHNEMRRRFGAAASIVAVEELTLAPAWHHALVRGVPVSGIRLPSGAALGPERSFLLFNRIRRTHMPTFDAAPESDRNYAQSEMYALLLSWIRSLGGRAVNPACPAGLAGPELSRLEMLSLAARAGLPVARYAITMDPRGAPIGGACEYRKIPGRLAPPGCDLAPAERPHAGVQPLVAMDCNLQEETALLAAGTFVTAGADLVPGILRLQDLTGCPLLELRLARAAGDGRWKVTFATPFPEQAQPRAVQIIADFLTERAQATGEAA
jgi:hypothetical protein